MFFKVLGIIDLTLGIINLSNNNISMGLALTVFGIFFLTRD